MYVWNNGTKVLLNKNLGENGIMINKKRAKFIGRDTKHYNLGVLCKGIYGSTSPHYD